MPTTAKKRVQAIMTPLRSIRAPSRANRSISSLVPDGAAAGLFCIQLLSVSAVLLRKCLFEIGQPGIGGLIQNSEDMLKGGELLAIGVWDFLVAYPLSKEKCLAPCLRRNGMDRLKMLPFHHQYKIMLTQQL